MTKERILKAVWVPTKIGGAKMTWERVSLLETNINLDKMVWPSDRAK